MVTDAPHDTAAEEAVVAALMAVDYALPAVAAIVQPRDFFRETNGLIYAAELALWQRGIAPDLITVANELRLSGKLDAVGGVPYLARLTTDLPTAVGVEHYAQIVARDGTLRRLMSAGQQIAQLAWNGSPSIETALQSADAILKAVRDQAFTGGAIPTAGDAALADDEPLSLWLSNPRRLSGYPTGFHALDRMLNGIEPGRVIMPAARTSVGKTMFALALASRMATQRRILYVSLEMTAQQLSRRMAFAAAGIDKYAVRQRGSVTDAERDAIHAARAHLCDLVLWLDDSSGGQWPRVAARVEDAIARNDVQIVVLDHLDLIAAGSTRENRHAQLSEVMADLKALALRRGVAVLVLSQIKRTLNDPPTLDDLRESGSKEESSDVVLILDRPAARQRDLAPEATLHHQLDVYVLKNRDGETGHFPLWIDLATQRIDNWNDGKGPLG